MPFRPHTLAYRIRRLTDAGFVTVDQLATACGITRTTIDRIMAGATPSRQTEHSIVRVLSYHAKRLHLKLEPEIEPEAITREEYARGVKWDLDCYDGTQGLTLRNTQGRRIFHCTMPAGMEAEPLIGFLEWWIEMLDPTHLTVAKPSSGEAS